MKAIPHSIIKGAASASALLVIYGAVVTTLSGAHIAIDQFKDWWYFIITLAIGFGTQVGLFCYLKNAMRRQSSKKLLAVSGATSGTAMISCCAHYLANIVPLLGISAGISLIASYQKELFWFGIASNFVGIAYMARKIMQWRKSAYQTTP